MRAAWWAYRAELIDEAYRMLLRLIFDERGQLKKDRAGRAGPIDPRCRRCGTGHGADPAPVEDAVQCVIRSNRVRHLLRLSEVVMEGAQRAEASVQKSRLARFVRGNRRCCRRRRSSNELCVRIQTPRLCSPRSHSATR